MVEALVVNVDPFPREVTHPCRTGRKTVFGGYSDVKIDTTTDNVQINQLKLKSRSLFQLPVLVGNAAASDIETTAGAMQGFCQ